jgi:hypothetical protein
MLVGYKMFRMYLNKNVSILNFCSILNTLACLLFNLINWIEFYDK